MTTTTPSRLDVATMAYPEFIGKTQLEQQQTVAACLDGGQPFVLTGLNTIEGWASTAPEELYSVCVPPSLRIEADHNLSRHLSSGPESIKQSSFCVVSDATPCEKVPSAQEGHFLLVQGGEDTSLKWLITRPQNSHAMAVFLRHCQKRKPAQEDATEATVQEDMTEASWSKLPFTVYEYQQRIGDIIVLPRRSYSQAFPSGPAVSLIKWTTFTRSSVTDAFYEEAPVSRRLCLEEGIPLSRLCEAILVKAPKESSEFSVADMRAVVDVFDKLLRLERLPPSFKVAKRGSEATEDASQSEVVIHNTEGDSQCGACRSVYLGLRMVCARESRCKNIRSVCIECFMEGRGCSCGETVFETSRLITDLEAIRQDAVAPYQLDVESSPDALISSEVLQAAILHLESRRKGNAPHKRSSTLRCIGVGGAPSHSVPVGEIASCPGKEEGCGGQQVCKPHQLVRWGMHLVDYRIRTSESSTTFHQIHKDFAAQFNEKFEYHRDGGGKTQFLMPAAWEMKNQDNTVNRVWLALVFKPGRDEDMECTGSFGWYDEVLVFPKWVLTKHAPKRLRSRVPATAQAGHGASSSSEASTITVGVKRKLSAQKEFESPSTASKARRKTTSEQSQASSPSHRRSKPSPSLFVAPGQQQRTEKSSRPTVLRPPPSPSSFSSPPCQPIQPGEGPSGTGTSTRKEIVGAYSALRRAVYDSRDYIPWDEGQEIGRAMRRLESALDIGLLELPADIQA